MRHAITQKDEMGCGAACVAFAASASYEEVADILGRPKAQTVGFLVREIIVALDKFDLKYAYKYMKPHFRASLHEEGVIVFIKRSPRYPGGHYLIRHQGLWMDPWINFVLDQDVNHARSGYRQRLPGKPQWIALTFITTR